MLIESITIGGALIGTLSYLHHKGKKQETEILPKRESDFIYEYDPIENRLSKRSKRQRDMDRRLRNNPYHNPLIGHRKIDNDGESLTDFLMPIALVVSLGLLGLRFLGVI